MCSLLEKLLKENSWEPESIIGIGIGVPGPVDFSAGIAVSPPYYAGVGLLSNYPDHATVVSLCKCGCR